MAPSLLQSYPSAQFTSAIRLAWNTLHAGQLQSRSFFRVRSLACICYLCELPVNFTFDKFRAAYPEVDLFTFDPDLWAGLGANHHDKLAHIQVGRLKGFVLLQETNWTPAQPATLTAVHPHIDIAASNLPPNRQAVVVCASSHP